MSKLEPWDFQRKLEPFVLAGDLSTAESMALAALNALPASPFHIVGSLEISNDPQEVARYFDAFYRAESRRFKIKALYTEMNGFSINPDLWFCSPFAYEAEGGVEDWDWLSDWQSSDDHENLTITGLEKLQSAYADYNAHHNPDHQSASCYCEFVVIIKFQRLLKRAGQLMNDVRVPLYATAHDYDLITVIRPGR